MYISVQLALRWYPFTLPSPLPFSHTIRHSTSTAHTSVHAITPPIVQTYVIIPQTSHTSSTRIMSTFHNQYANSISPPIFHKSGHNSTNTPHACHPSTNIPPTRMSSFCQYSTPICHHTHHVSPFHQYSTLHISQISTHVFVITPPTLHTCMSSLSSEGAVITRPSEDTIRR
jgi:hypothetical protein